MKKQLGAALLVIGSVAAGVLAWPYVRPLPTPNGKLGRLGLPTYSGIWGGARESGDTPGRITYRFKTDDEVLAARFFRYYLPGATETVIDDKISTHVFEWPSAPDSDHHIQVEVTPLSVTVVEDCKPGTNPPPIPDP